MKNLSDEIKIMVGWEEDCVALNASFLYRTVDIFLPDVVHLIALQVVDGSLQKGVRPSELKRYYVQCLLQNGMLDIKRPYHHGYTDLDKDELCVRQRCFSLN